MMNNRLKDVRKAAKLSQDDFGQRIGVTGTALSRWESGDRKIPDSAILNICREFGVNETWLRTGYGEMFAPRTREAELGELIRTRLINRPESFQTALITTLLRFDPDGPEWAALERIVENLKAETEKDREP